MGWATAAIERLRQGQTAVVRPRGHSMTGKVNDGDVVTVEPLGERELRVGDVVLCKVSGREYLHLVEAVQDRRYLIGNNRGGVNGWVGRAAIFGVATAITPRESPARRRSERPSPAAPPRSGSRIPTEGVAGRKPPR